MTGTITLTDGGDFAPCRPTQGRRHHARLQRLGGKSQASTCGWVAWRGQRSNDGARPLSARGSE